MDELKLIKNFKKKNIFDVLEGKFQRSKPNNYCNGDEWPHDN